MASEVIKLNLIPKGEMPVFHASQFDTGRLITCELYRGEDAYSVPEGYTVELHCRKVDNNIVTMASTLINDNVVTFTSTEQLTACNGKNLCEVAILDEGYRIGTLNFILEVEIDPLKGGITSTSEIHNLETQVEEITTEIIGENYYNKTEVDDLLDTKADADSVYTIGEVNSLLSGKANAADVYTKSQTDTLLSAKADSSDVYTKGQVDTALSAKADTTYVDAEVDDLEAAISAKADASTTTAALATKADKSDTYTKEQVDALIDNIFPTLTASGSIASFTTALTKPLVSVTAAAGATEVTACGVNLFGFENWLISKNVRYTKEGNTYTITLTQAIYSEPFVFSGNDTQIILSAVITNETSTNCRFDILNSNNVVVGNLYEGTSYTIVTGSKIRLNWSTTGIITVTTPHIEVGNQASEYQDYNGQTVPVADATTLTTQSGINNVYADAGDITVQYKYMSI